MVVTMLSVEGRTPAGGVMAIWEFADGLARRGHEVHVIHTGLLGSQIRALDEVDWYEFDDKVQHHFAADPSDAGEWRSDFVFCLFGEPPDRGLPLMWVQAYKGFPAYVEKTIFGAPFPKVCTSTFLRDTAVELGVRPEQAVHVPYGLNHDKYRVVKPVGERRPRVAMLYHEAPIKGAAVGITALELVKRRVPELEVVLFGVADERPVLPDWMTYRYQPSQSELVDDIFNGSRVFVMPSLLEGFGLVATEAMACGCALVASDSGGSRDYAIDGDTALVCDPGDAPVMATHIESVLRDPELHAALAGRGIEFVRRFDWDDSAARLEQFLQAYASDPDHYRQAESGLSWPNSPGS
jgi:L-malate glycosyltransferase